MIMTLYLKLLLPISGIWSVVGNIVYVSIYWQSSSQLAHIFQKGRVEIPPTTDIISMNFPFYPPVIKRGNWNSTRNWVSMKINHL